MDFNTTLVKVHHLLNLLRMLLKLISIQLLLRFIMANDTTKRITAKNFNTTLVKVHPDPLKNKLIIMTHFNTTLVKVHQYIIGRIMRSLRHFNTTLVKVHRNKLK